MAKAAREKYDDQPLPKKPTPASGSTRGRKLATTNGKEVVAQSNTDTTTHTNGQTNGHSSGPVSQSPWHSTPLDLLHSYRSAHRLGVAAAYANPHAHQILEHGIGRYSPSMARARTKRRVPKDALALAVRKHFNSLAVNESEAFINTLYKARTNEKSLRLKFPASKPR